MIGIIDYGMGNIHSVQKALESMGATTLVTNDARKLSGFDKLVLPGVGAFDDAMIELENRSLDAAIKGAVADKKIILGICLGMQLFFDESQEAESKKGLRVFPGAVKRFGNTLKVPHMGWNNVSLRKQSDLFKNISLAAEFYFVHSFHIESKKSVEVLGTTNYEYEFVSALEKENIFGLQFHPEKSHDVGEKVLLNFLQL